MKLNENEREFAVAFLLMYGHDGVLDWNSVDHEALWFRYHGIVAFAKIITWLCKSHDGRIKLKPEILEELQKEHHANDPAGMESAGS